MLHRPSEMTISEGFVCLSDGLLSVTGMRSLGVHRMYDAPSPSSYINTFYYE